MHKQYKHKSKSHRWGDWGDWTWHEDYQRYYRCRIDSEGNRDYQWDDRDITTATGATHQDIPRADSVDEITRDIDQLEVGTGDVLEDDVQDDNYKFTHDTHDAETSRDKGKSKASTHHPTSKRSSSKERSSRKSKGKSTYRGQSDDEALLDSHAAQYYYPQTHRDTRGAAEDDASSIAIDPDSSVAQIDGEEAYNMAAAMRGSRAYRQAPLSAHGSYGSVYDSYEPLDDEYRSATPTGLYSSSYAAPESSAVGQLDPDQLDPRYRVERSSKFSPGSIFKAEWSEPLGAGNDGASVTSKQELKNRFGTKFWVGFRRFIVVANDQGNCTCVPILTYGGKACKKSGVKPEKHGIIYQRGHRAKPLDREPKLGFTPVRAELTEESEKLSKESRVNYAKLTTIEHNIRVFFIGHIYPSDWEIVRESVNLCWERKTHHPRLYNREV